MIKSRSKLIVLLMGFAMLFSCGKDEISYPAKFIYKSNNITPATFYAQQESGFSEFDVFGKWTMIDEIIDDFYEVPQLNGFSYIELLSDTTLVIEKTDNQGNVLSEEFSYKFENSKLKMDPEVLDVNYDKDEGIISFCFQSGYTFKNIINGDKIGSCDLSDSENLEILKERYLTMPGDTVALSVLEIVFEAE